MGKASSVNLSLTAGDQREGVYSPSTSLWGPLKPQEVSFCQGPFHSIWFQYIFRPFRVWGAKDPCCFQLQGLALSLMVSLYPAHTSVNSLYY